MVIVATDFFAVFTLTEDIYGNLLDIFWVFYHHKVHCTKMKFSVKDIFSKCDQIADMQIWSHLLKKSLMENFSFFAVIKMRVWRKPYIKTLTEFQRNMKTKFSKPVKC